MPDELPVLYQDAHLIAVSKPSGWLSHGWKGGQTGLEDRLRRLLAPEDPSRPYLGALHRLDRPVSGVILWALTPKAARRLSAQFADRSIHKRYWAIVEGEPPDLPPLWTDWLCEEDTGLGRVQTCSPGTPRARLASTRARKRTDGRLPSGSSWLDLRPETGRTHQLRVQCSSRGCPILGDRLYGARLTFGPEPHIALHALEITFRHPILDRPMTLQAPVPDWWKDLGIFLP
jgi:23S rRNA-/tRNA-specific pseudouridylate synthase